MGSVSTSSAQSRVQGPSEPSSAEPHCWGFRFGGCLAQSQRKCSTRHPHTFRRRCHRAKGCRPPVFQAASQATAGGSQDFNAKTFWPSFLGTGNSPAQMGMLYSVYRKCLTNAGKALHFSSKHKVNSSFLPQHTPGQKASLPLGEPTRMTTKSQISQAGIRCHQAPGSPETHSIHHPCVSNFQIICFSSPTSFFTIMISW